MALVTAFFSGQQAIDINNIINTNFSNIAKYIPSDFLSMGTVDRLALTADYKKNGKLVYDTDLNAIYKWNQTLQTWQEHQFPGVDTYARGMAQEVSSRAFTSVSLGEDCVARFRNNFGTEMGNFVIDANHVFYDSNNTTFSKIGSMMSNLNDQASSLQTVTTQIGTTTLPTTNKTITGAINEIYNKTNGNTNSINNIVSGNTIVGQATKALNVDVASNSQLLEGYSSSYFATQSDMNSLNTSVGEISTDVYNNRQNIATNTADISTLKTEVEGLDENVGENTTSINTLKANVNTIIGKINGITGLVILKGYIDTIDTSSTAKPASEQLNLFCQTTLGTEPETGWGIRQNDNEHLWVCEVASTEGITHIVASVSDLTPGTTVGEKALINNRHIGDPSQTIGKQIAIWNGTSWDIEYVSNWTDIGISYTVSIATDTDLGVIKGGGDITIDGQGIVKVNGLENMSSKKNSLSDVELTSNPTVLNFFSEDVFTENKEEYDITVKEVIIKEQVYDSEGNPEYTEGPSGEEEDRILVTTDVVTTKQQQLTILDEFNTTNYFYKVFINDRYALDNEYNLTTSTWTVYGQENLPTTDLVVGMKVLIINTDTTVGNKLATWNGTTWTFENATADSKGSVIITITNLQDDETPWQVGWMIKIVSLIKTVTPESRIELPRKITSKQVISNGSTLQDTSKIEFTGDLVNSVITDISKDATVVNITLPTGQAFVTGVSIKEHEYYLTISNASLTQNINVVNGYNPTTDTVKLFVNGTYVNKNNYSINYNSSTNIMTINTLDTTWRVGSEITVLVTNIQIITLD